MFSLDFVPKAFYYFFYFFIYMVFYRKNGVWYDSEKNKQRLLAELELALQKGNAYIEMRASKNSLGDGEGEEIRQIK